MYKQQRMTHDAQNGTSGPEKRGLSMLQYGAKREVRNEGLRHIHEGRGKVRRVITEGGM